ncbi:hypothetical protein PS6_002230 [Mucor atramentarius]
MPITTETATNANVKSNHQQQSKYNASEMEKKLQSRMESCNSTGTRSKSIYKVAGASIQLIRRGV